MKHQQRRLNLFADYFQFYVCDSDFQTDTVTLWDDATCDRMLAVGTDLLAVGTARNVNVPATLEVSTSEPAQDFSEWDQVIECSFGVPSGTLIAFGCTVPREKAERLKIDPGSYRARVSYGDLADLSDNRLEGNDRYRVQLWPGEAEGVTIVKCRQGC